MIYDKKFPRTLANFGRPLSDDQLLPGICSPEELLLKGTGSRFSASSLIKLLFSNLLLILPVNNPTHKVMYLSYLRVYSKVFQSNLKWDGGVLKSQKN